MRSLPGTTIARSPAGAECGLSLVELVIFIVVISVGLAGILGVMNFTNRSSADPLIQKQALAIAEAYLEEILAMPFTYCDPDDVNAATAESATTPPTDTTRCASNIEVMGAENMGGLESRGSTTRPFDNVNDYSSLAAGVPTMPDGVTTVSGLGDYQVSVAVVAEALGSVTSNESLRVTVTVTGPINTTVRLDGYRTRYAPNALP